MILEVTGGGFVNKGAQLMLATVCERLRSAMDTVQICVPFKHRRYEDSALNRARYKLLIAIEPPRHWKAPRRYARDYLCKVVGRTTLGPALGLCPENQVDGLIDISGYAYGDHWSPKKAENLKRKALAFKKRDKPVVLLPQTLGPFQRRAQADAFEELARLPDAIYARDEPSLRCARPLVDENRLRLAPDITIAALPKFEVSCEKPYACIVPNSKVLTRDVERQQWSDTYLNRLVKAARHFGRRGLRVILMQHEYSPGDTELVEALLEEIGHDVHVEVEREFDPQVLKCVLAGATVVVGSRFHSLVSTLSMAVPAIALGWAHKYDALLNDFGVPELIHGPTDSEGDLITLIDRAIDLRSEYVNVLCDRRRRLTARVETMWVEVFEMLGIRSTSGAGVVGRGVRSNGESRSSGRG